jgi:hypothetical protein
MPCKDPDENQANQRWPIDIAGNPPNLLAVTLSARAITLSGQEIEDNLNVGVCSRESYIVSRDGAGQRALLARILLPLASDRFVCFSLVPFAVEDANMVA